MKIKISRHEVRKCVFPAIAGGYFSFCYVAGYQLDCFDTLNLRDKGFYLRWAAVAAGISVLLYILWHILDVIPIQQKKQSSEKIKGGMKTRLICMALLFLCWLPALLSIFPGVFSYDALDEWEQVHNWMLTAHHPVAHVLLLGGFTEGFFLLTGSYNVGIAVYTVLQMLILAWALSAVVEFMEYFEIPRFGRILTLLFYALSPVMQLFSICATKDVLFTAAELIFFLYVIQFSLSEEFAGDRKKMIFFGLSALCTMIFRNNGVYIVLPTLLVLVIVRRRGLKKYRKNILIFLLVTAIPYFLYTVPMHRVLNVEPGGVEEMLSVPLQQMARVYRYDYDSLNDQDLETLYRFVERDALEQYRPTVSDFVKSGFDGESFRNHKGDFFSLWIRLGIEHPLTYVNSFLVNTVDAWYPHAMIDGYRHGDGRGSYFDYRVSPPGEEKVFLRGLHKFYEELSHDLQAQKRPLAFLALSPGWYLLCVMFLFFYFWSRRKYNMLFPLLMFVFHMITVLLGPMILVRYMLVFFAAFPVVCAMAFGRKD